MPLAEAELWKDNAIRSQLGLENLDELPRPTPGTAKTCRRCGRPSGRRCSACRTRYCSTFCRKKDWSRHVFVCAVPRRPNDVDYLKMAERYLSWVASLSDDEEQELARERFLRWFFANDRLCRLYGFTMCLDWSDVVKLLCLYRHALKLGNRALASLGESVGAFLEGWTQHIHDTSRPAHALCDCVPWYLSKIAEGGVKIPDWEGNYFYLGVGQRRAEHLFGIGPASDDEPPFPPDESAVVQMFGILLRPFNNLPDPQSAYWMRFGFWGCRNRAETKSFAKLYLSLAESGASLTEITHAWATSSLSLLELMASRGIDASFCHRNDLQLGLPDQDTMGAYGLMAEVSHALSGRYCSCFRSKDGQCSFHPKHETHLSSESDGDYGFHGANPWERWQLLNFYHHLFQHPEFDALKMQEARRHSEDRGALEQYIETLIPGFRKSISNFALGDVMFPKLKMRLIFPNGRAHCYCVVHDTVAPQGLDWRIQFTFHDDWVRGGTDEDP